MVYLFLGPPGSGTRPAIGRNELDNSLTRVDPVSVPSGIDLEAAYASLELRKMSWAFIWLGAGAGNVATGSPPGAVGEHYGIDP